MENLFEGAKFGDKFIMRNGNIVVFIMKYQDNTRVMCVTPNSTLISWALDGLVIDGEEHAFDIVSRYQPSEEEISEKADFYSRIFVDRIEMQDKVQNFIEGFETGYKKALNLI